MAEAETMTGGCACGKVRFEAGVKPDEAYLCHCRMCQRSTGSVSIAFVNAMLDDVRWQGEPEPRYEIDAGDLHLDLERRVVTLRGTEVRLTRTEFELLRYLAERREKVFHREELLKEVWGYMDTNVTTRSVDHAIVRLRKKIEPDPHHPEFIRTVHGDGYCLSATQVG